MGCTRGEGVGWILPPLKVFSIAFIVGTYAVHLSLRHILAKLGKNQLLWLQDTMSQVV